MKQYLARMKALLVAGMEGTGVPDRGVSFESSGIYFRLGQSGIEVVLNRDATWRVRELYLFADLQEGGERPIGLTVAEGKIGDEVAIAKAAIMRMLELRVNAGLDSVA